MSFKGQIRFGVKLSYDITPTTISVFHLLDYNMWTEQKGKPPNLCPKDRVTAMRVTGGRHYLTACMGCFH
jgi:hypothetical protein